MTSNQFLRLIILSFFLILSGSIIAQDCSIHEVYAEAHSCDENGQFFVDVEFEVIEIGNEGFEIRGNGVSYGDDFQYGQPFYTIGPLTGNCETIYEFVVIDNQIPNCGGSYVFEEPVCCNPDDVCSINEINLDYLHCYNDSLFSFYLNFEHQFTSDNGFYVWSDTTFLGNYSYSDLPVYIDSFQSRQLNFEHLRICDKDDEMCCTEYEFLTPNCDSLSCYIINVFVEIHECNADNQFFVDVVFDAVNPGSLGFEIRGNGVSYGHEFEYGQAFYTIGPLNGNCETLYEFVVIDNENTDCSGAIQFEEAVCCESDNTCEIRDIEVGEFRCNEDGTYALTLDFIHENTTNEFFDVWAGNIFVGTYRYDKLPVRIEVFYPRDVEHDLIRICDNDNPNCCATEEFIGPDCERHEDCSIGEIEVGGFDCNEDGTYSLNLNFVHENTTNEFFDVWAGNIYVGFFRYEDLPIRIEVFYSRDAEYDLIKICDNDNPNCCATEEFIGPDCERHGDCSIGEIEVGGFDCNEDGTYSLNLNFTHENTTNEFFDVWAGNEFVGHYRYDDLPVRIQKFYPRNLTHDLIRICDNDNPECCAIKEFIGPDCEDNGDCSISEIEVGGFDCNEDGTYSLNLDFIHKNTTNDFFKVWAGNEFVGLYRYDDLPVRIQKFYPRDVAYDLIRICDNENPNCCAVKEFIGPDCESHGDCTIRDIEVGEFKCNEDGTYALSIDFIHENTTNEFFDVWAGNIFIGYYKYADLPVRIDTFYPRNVEHDLIKICDNDNPECCAVKEFIGPDCENNGDCSIRDIEVGGFDCNDDGTYSLNLNFIHENTNSEFFKVWAGNVFVGLYSYDDLPVRIQKFYPRDLEHDLIRICEIDNPNCCAVKEFVGPDCENNGDCSIRDVEVGAFDCNDDGTYSLKLDFIHENTTNEFFDVWAGNIHVGFFRYDDLPVRIEKFYPRDAEYDLIKICDNDNPNCCVVWEFMGPDCERSNCGLEELIVIATPCIEGEYYLIINVDYSNNLSEAIFKLNGSGKYFGNYASADFPVALGPFDGESGIHEIVITLLEHPECFLEVAAENTCEDMVDAVDDLINERSKIYLRHSNLIVERFTDQNYTMSLYDLNGQLILQSIGRGDSMFNVSEYSSGLYLVRLKEETGRYVAGLIFIN